MSDLFLPPTLKAQNEKLKALVFAGSELVKIMETHRSVSLEALKEIAKGEGRFSRDKLTHAANTIEDMQAIARVAIASCKQEGGKG